MRLSLLLVLFVSIAAPVYAQGPDLIDADRPGLAESSTVIGKGRLQVEAGLQWESRGGEKTAFVPLLFRIGLTDRFEARIEGDSFSTVSVAGGVRHSGLAPTSLGFEFVLQDREAKRPGVGLIARVEPAWGSGGFKSHHVTGDVRLAVDWDFADHLSLNPNVGIARSEDESGTFTAGLFALTLSYAPKPSVSWFVDTGIQVPEVENGTASVIVDAGVAYIPRPNWQFDISAGTSAHGDTPPRPFISAGISFRHK